MSFSLTTSFDDCFEFKGTVFNVDMSFDNILLLFEMFDDEEVYEHEKVFIALQLLIDEFEELSFESFEETYELFKYIMDEFLDIDLDHSSEKQTKFLDYHKDADLIYASFFAIYRIDLFELKGKLHWKKFQALLSNLSDDSALKQVIGYRTMKIPTDKEATKEYREHVLRMKRIYSLEEQSNANTVFDSLAMTFKASTKGV